MDVGSCLLMFLVIAYSSCLGIGYGHQEGYNVLDFGAKGNSEDDDSQAFLKAWDTLCGLNKGTPTLRVPKGKTYFLRPLTFSGPCKSDNIRIQIDGNIVAPQTLDGWKAGCEDGRWLQFENVNNLVISGAGTFDGRGSMFWTGDKNIANKCKAPTALRFYRCNNLQLEGFTSLNSPNKHIGLHSCSDISVSHLHIRAPKTSPNTDGILISSSTYIRISDSYIGTGDDCISIKSGSSRINITHVACGPGHGISVGSLGIGGGNHSVEQVHVRNCSFEGTTNGARIKTFKGGYGFARAISFEHIRVSACKNPIIIDQNYREFRNIPQNIGVQISDVTYRDIVGTSLSDNAISFDCGLLGCKNILLDRIKLLPASSRVKVTSYCRNADVKARFTRPRVNCQSKMTT